MNIKIMNRNEIRLRTETLTNTSVKAVGDKCWPS